MTQAVLSGYRELLHTKLRELRSPCQALDGITVLRSADSLQETENRFDRDPAIVIPNHDSSIVRAVAMGLRRIEQGTFGRCTNCGGDINRRRLDAVPWTPLCIECQRSGEAGVPQIGDLWFPEAA